MRHIEKMIPDSIRKQERNIYSGERNRKKNKPKRGRKIED
jgi:hypothetical protein